jgi:hypothetical protein
MVHIKLDGNVELAWNAESGSGIDKFEHRKKYKRTGMAEFRYYPVKNATQKIDYTYIDNVGKNTALKKIFITG